MTLVAMILSIIVGTGSLAYGYSQAGMPDPARWCVLLGIVWILAHWRKYYWFSALGLFLTIIAAAYGVWNSFTTIWMLLGALGGLLGWDLSDFAMRLSYAAPTDDIQGMERRHLERAGIVLGQPGDFCRSGQAAAGRCRNPASGPVQKHAAHAQPHLCD